MKTMDGAISSATRKSSRTSFGPSPRYFWMSSEPTTEGEDGGGETRGGGGVREGTTLGGLPRRQATG